MNKLTKIALAITTVVAVVKVVLNKFLIKSSVISSKNKKIILDLKNNVIHFQK